jgi:hypothetical protein
LAALASALGCAAALPPAPEPTAAEAPPPVKLDPAPGGKPPASEKPPKPPPPLQDRRSKWAAASATYVNTGVRREPDYFDSPYKDVQARGGGEPRFFDLRRDVAAVGYEPVRWLVNGIALPYSAVVEPYWNRPLDHGPVDPAKPVPNERVVQEPRRVDIDQ